MDLRPTNGDEKLPVEPYDPWQSRDRKGADDSPNFRPFFKGADVLKSFRPQRHHRIDPRRALRWKPRR